MQLMSGYSTLLASFTNLGALAFQCYELLLTRVSCAPGTHASDCMVVRRTLFVNEVVVQKSEALYWNSAMGFQNWSNDQMDPS